MVVGIVGYMVMLCVIELEKGGLSLLSGFILVMGVVGGVGSVVIVFFLNLGYEVIVFIGWISEVEYLKSLGVFSVIDCKEFFELGCFFGKE